MLVLTSILDGVGTCPTLSAKCHKSLILKDLSLKRLQECIPICVSILKPFLFSRAQKHYVRFFVPIALREHFGKKFLVFALGSGAGHEIRLKAHQLAHNLTNTCNELLENLAMNKPRQDFDLSNIRTYEIDLKNGYLKTDGSPEDHQRAIEALNTLKELQGLPMQQPAGKVPETPPKTASRGIKMAELVEQYFKLKKQLKPATALAYGNVAKEFAQYIRKQHVADITESDVLRYQNWLADKGNATRTIDNKLINLHALFKFAIQQKHYFNENPCANKALMTKKQRLKEGYGIFEREEIEAIFSSDFMKVAKEKDKDYFYTLFITLFTGMRIGEVTSLQKDQFKVSNNGNHYIVIRDSKTLAGQREIPLYKPFYHFIKPFIDSKEDKIFKYEQKDGKGSGNAAGKKFPRHLKAAGVTRQKLVFHSLRKFTNNEMKANKVSIEARCQILGHEFDNVNSAIYSNEFNIDELAEETKDTFKSIFELTKKHITIDF